MYPRTIRLVLIAATALLSMPLLALVGSGQAWEPEPRGRGAFVGVLLVMVALVGVLKLAPNRPALVMAIAAGVGTAVVMVGAVVDIGGFAHVALVAAVVVSYGVALWAGMEAADPERQGGV